MTSAPITTSDLAQRTQDDSLTLREKIGYGLGDAGGTVSVSTMEIFAVTILPPILRDLRAAHPGIHIHLDTSDEPRDLATGAADIAIRSSKQPTGAGLVGRRIDDRYRLTAETENVLRITKEII